LSKLRSATSIEIEIQSLLVHFRETDLAADSLLKKYETQKLSLSEFESLSVFLLHCGFFATLTDFILRKFEDGSKIPWAHFAEALFLSAEAIEPEIKAAIIEGAEENFSLSHLSRTHNLDEFDAELPVQRVQRRKKFQTRYQDRKKELLQEIEMLRVQKMNQEQEKLVQVLAKFFPDASEIYHLRGSIKESMAEEYLARRPEKKKKQKKIHTLPEVKTEEEKNLLKSITETMSDQLKAGDILAEDFAVAQLTWENEEAALDLLDAVTDTPRRLWIKADLLLRSRRFAELLEHLRNLEIELAAEPETLFAAHYLKAQALWGLDQKKSAIQILEEMLEARPDYRSARSLLNEWKEELT
jgi:tetratricopeptide (TPR) repeat protein